MEKEVNARAIYATLIDGSDNLSYHNIWIQFGSQVQTIKDKLDRV